MHVASCVETVQHIFAATVLLCFGIRRQTVAVCRKGFAPSLQALMMKKSKLEIERDQKKREREGVPWLLTGSVDFRKLGELVE